MALWPGAHGEMTSRVRGFDWASTSLGPAAAWPAGFRQILEMVLENPLPSMVVRGPERVLIYNDAAAATFGDRHPDALGRPIDQAFPSVYPVLQSAYDRAFAGEAFRVLRHPSEFGGARRPGIFDLYFTPMRDEAGEVATVLVQGFEVSDLVATEAALHDSKRQLKRAVAELQHRVRNILAVVRAMVARTGESSETVEDFTNHLLGRLNAMGRTQVTLTRAQEGGVDLESIVRDELRAHASEERRVAISGPEVRLSAKAAEVLTLAVHELATNAIKFGALGAREGRVNITWRVLEQDEGHVLTFAWREDGVRVAVIAPRREGFGVRLIEQRVPYELNGAGWHRLMPGGISCEISFPLISMPSLLQDAEQLPVAAVARDHNPAR